MSRWARRVDRTQAPIVKALRAAGCSVFSLARVGEGCPDLLVGIRGVTHLLEVKSPRTLVPGAGGSLLEKITARDQAKWRDGWRGGPACVVHGPAEALAAIGLDEMSRAYAERASAPEAAQARRRRRKA